MASRKVLLVGWDAADWKVIRPLMDEGRMPHLRALVEQGASGQISTLHPPISPMLWTSIATGKRPFQHGIHGFAEPTMDGRDVRPVTNLSRTARAVWNILGLKGLRSVVVGWWPSHPAEPIQGAMVSDLFHRAAGPIHDVTHNDVTHNDVTHNDVTRNAVDAWPMLKGSVHPPELAARIAALRVHPDHLTPELVEPFVPLASEIDQETDPRLGLLLRTLAEAMSVEAAAVGLLEDQAQGAQAWDFAAVYFDSIDHFCHGFMKYHPPRQSWVSARDFELYRDVVAAAYEFHDRALGRMLEKAGPQTTVLVVSDHGFHPDHLRPASIPEIPAGPTIEHRDYGIVALCGEGIRKNSQIYGASVLDITPTILALFGLPIGADMDGRVLTQAFVRAPRPKSIPTWEQVPGQDGCHPAHARLNPEAARASLDQMIALGYVQAPEEDAQTAVRKTIQELRYNLGEAYQDAGRHREAHAIFSELRAAEPGEPRFAARLFVSCQALNLHAEMRSIAADLDDSPLAAYCKAQTAMAEGCDAEAAAVLEGLGLLVEAGDAYARLRQRREADRVYRLALELDADNAAAHLGLSRIALEHRRYDAAAHSALDALQRVHRYPQGHLLLGRALAGMKKYKQAAEAYRAAISCNPHFPEAHTRLAGLLEKNLGDPDGARAHRRLVRRMRQGQGIASRVPETRAAAHDSPADRTGNLDSRVPLAESVVIVTGLPRTGTSMTMQMLAAGGVGVLTDHVREPDESNPQGYYEYEPVKRLLEDSGWLREARGKAVKIVLPLLAALPEGLPARVILCERDLDEVLDSQKRMLARDKAGGDSTMPNARREMLRAEYARIVWRAKGMLAARSSTALLVLERRAVLGDPQSAARELDRFLGGGLNVAKIAAAVLTKTV